MATVTRENIGTLHDKITVKLAREDYMAAYDKKLKDYAKKADIPGFRKGMVPAALVRKMYGTSVLNEEVVGAAGKKLDEYIRKERLMIFAQPMFVRNGEKPVDFNTQADIDLAFEIGLKPDFDVHTVIQNGHLTRYNVVVSDKLLDDEIKRIQEQQGTEDEQNEVTTKENIIYAEYALCDAQGNVEEGVTACQDTRGLDKLPAKLQDMLMGKKPADSIVIRAVDVCSEEELPGFLKDVLKTGQESAELDYKLTLEKTGILIPAKMGPELYANVYKNTEVKDEAEFREKIKAELANEFGRITNERFQNAMFEYLVHNVHMQLPVDFLKRYMKEGSDKTKTQEEVDKEYPGFEHSLRWQLISDKIMGEAGINVTRQEVERDVKTSLLSYFGLGPDDEDETPWMEGYMAKMIKDDKMMDETYRRLLYGKLFAFLATQFPVEEKEIVEEEFFKLADAGHHHHH
jgi:trigger factor